VPARLLRANEDGTRQAIVSFPAGESGVSPGQACVFYETDANDGRVLGGGTVTRMTEPRPMADPMLAAAS
jgi:tRNA-specific 2-thiouridylase